MHELHLLSRIPLFTGLTKRELQKLVQITRHQHFARHHVIIKAGERGNVLFLLLRGIVRVSMEGSRGKEIILGMLHPNDFFGEMALLDGLPRSATVTAMEDCEVLVITRQDFLECIKKLPQVAAKIIIALSLRIRRTDQKLENLVLLRAPRRVARTLLEVARAQGQSTERGVAVDLRFTRRELAELAGVSRETFARLLTKFQQMGVLTIERRSLLIPDTRRLEDLG